MFSILITGSNGFIGRHMLEALGRRPDLRVFAYDLENTPEELSSALAQADVIYHLAGINRPKDPKEFQTGNAGFTQQICHSLMARGRSPTIIMSSSIQAELDNPYGISKREAEKALEEYATARGQRTEIGDRRSEVGGQSSEIINHKLEIINPQKAVIFRLKNVFGKWCRPNYNSVVATFCHNIAHDLPITISDPNKELELVYIDDVISAFLSILDEVRSQKSEVGAQKPEVGAQKSEIRDQTSDVRPPISDFRSLYRGVSPSYKVTLGELAAKIRSFRDSRRTLVMPSMADDFTRCLYATYLSYLDPDDFAYNLDLKTDNRGCLAEFMKSKHFGQIFVSRTKPGITRGNHYHHTKTEKFLILEGEAVVRMRHIQGAEVRDQKPEIGSQMSKDRRQKSEVGNQKSALISDLRSPISDVRPPTSVAVSDSTSDVRLPTSDLRPPTSVLEFPVSGKDLRVLDIPPGYTHSIENVGQTDLVVLFWSSELFDPAKPDTIPLEVRSQMSEVADQRSEVRSQKSKNKN